MVESAGDHSCGQNYRVTISIRTGFMPENQMNGRDAEEVGEERHTRGDDHFMAPLDVRVGQTLRPSVSITMS